MENFAPLCNYTHYSLQLGFSRPKPLVQKCKENGYTACGIADYKSISGTVRFFQECKKAKIKPIIGCSFDGFSLFAKNKNGWFDLIGIISGIQSKDEMTVIHEYATRGNLIYVGSSVNGAAFAENDRYTKDNIKNYFYVDKSDVDIHRISLCSGLKIPLPDMMKQIGKGTVPKEVKPFVKFFTEDSFAVPSKEEATPHKDIGEIISKCEDYNILEKPRLPKFPTPNGESEEEYLKDLCRKGWLEMLSKTKVVEKEEVKQKYLDRFNEEFGVIKGAKLFGYFLIVWDVINFVKSKGWVSGAGRGSAAGCLISYLLGITKLDPIKFDLLFSRFYNAGRNTADHVSLPDIDIDIPGGKRDEVIAYLKSRYGADNVSQMITFGRLQGRSSLKEVLRMNKACGFNEMNAMTKPIPDEAAISDQLEEMDEEDRSIIRWTLINSPDDLRQWCHLDEEGNLRGDYASYFDQAIRLEGTFKSQGKHAAGVVISKDPIHLVCPMLPDKDGELLAGLEMNDLEALGHVKLDVLGLKLLDKFMEIQLLIEEGNND